MENYVLVDVKSTAAAFSSILRTIPKFAPNPDLAVSLIGPMFVYHSSVDICWFNIYIFENTLKDTVKVLPIFKQD